MMPRLIVIQPSHNARNPELEPGTWALHHEQNNREPLGHMVRCCVLACRFVARIIYPFEGGMSTGRDPAQDRTATYFDTNSDEYRMVRNRSMERQRPENGEPIYVEGPELLLHIHSPQRVLATYFASSRTAREALMDGYMPYRADPCQVFGLTLTQMSTRSFSWHVPVWQRSASVWRGAAKQLNAITEFLQPCDPLRLDAAPLPPSQPV